MATVDFSQGPSALLASLFRSGTVQDEDGNLLTVKRALANVAAGTTDGAVVTGVEGYHLRILAAAVMAGGTATNVTFNTKPAGAGSAISCLFACGANGGVVLPHNRDGWFQTAADGGLTVTTGAGATVGVQVTYVEVPE
jgi:hypothetical protein